MRNFLLRLIINAVALAVTAAILPGIHISDNGVVTLLLVAFIFGIVNAVFKPLMLLLSCPLVILTFGLFILVVNGLTLLITDSLAGDRFTVDSLGWAILAGLIIGIAAGLLEDVFGLDDDEDEDDIIIYSS